MNCSPFDLKDYFLQELPNPQRREVEGHLTRCPACREELDRLHLTQAALFSLRDEEIPQRIAFVSDKVFEPSPWRRWWSGAPKSSPVSAARIPTRSRSRSISQRSSRVSAWPASSTP